MSKWSDSHQSPSDATSNDPSNDNDRPSCANCAGRVDRLPSRRRVLSLAGYSTGFVLAGGALAGCGVATGSPPTGPVSAGKVSALTVDTMIVMGNVVVARDANGVYAMSGVCTHAGCLLEDTSGTVGAGLYCACHGSSFDGNGGVTHGPARAALTHYAVTIAPDGSITVDGSQPVSAGTRTPIA